MSTSGDSQATVEATAVDDEVLEEEETPTASSLCARCNKPGELRCSGCHDCRYCSTTCQRNDWIAHKTLCRSFSSFPPESRPGPNHYRAIIFPVDEPSPRFVWVEYYEEFGLRLEYTEATFRSHITTLDFNCYRPLCRKLGHTIRVYFNDSFLEDGSPINQSISKLTSLGVAVRWRDVFVAVGIENDEEDEDEYSNKPKDLGTADLEPIVDFFKFRAAFPRAEYTF